jgi:electron transfer flavoprotein beta subunit
MADIAVLLKQVPDTNAKIVVNGGRVDEGAVNKWSMSPYDEYALEAALSLGGSITAITCGPDRAKKMLTDAAAVGASELMHIVVDDLTTLDSSQMASVLAAAVEKTGASVVFCGKQAADTNAGSTGPGVAERLGAGCVTMVSELSGDSSEFLALRPSASGMERVSISAPCVIAFDKMGTELRRPNVKGIMMAKKKTIETLSVGDLGVDVGSSSVTLDNQSPPAEKPAGQKFEGADSVSTVVAKLRDEAKVI